LAGLPGAGAGRPADAPPAPEKRPRVGRGEELAALHAALESAAAGRGLLVCVTGEPGLGKTTLVEDFLAELAAGDRPCGVARGRCSERPAGTEAYFYSRRNWTPRCLARQVLAWDFRAVSFRRTW